MGERAREAKPRERKKRHGEILLRRGGRRDLAARFGGGEVSRWVLQEKLHRIGRNEGLRRVKV